MKKRIKMTIALLLALIMAAALCSCGGEETKAEEKGSSTMTTEQEEKTSGAVSNEQILDTLNDGFADMGHWEYNKDLKAYILYEHESVNTLEATMEYYLANGYDDFLAKNWGSFRESFVGLGQTVCASSDAEFIGVANPKNPDNLLLTIDANGVVYDAFEN